MKFLKELDSTLVIFCTTICLAHFVRCMESTNDIDNEKIVRARRDISDFEDIKSNDDKRQREFIGKRSADEALDMDELDSDSDGYMYDNNVDKRLREFIGKRSSPEFETEKRMRDFLGKRDFDIDDMEKRQREFVGKRSQYYDNDAEDDTFDTYDKRLREFIGKRDYNDYSYLAKRLREFVGKRLTPEGYYRRLRQPRYQRELIGKRSSPALYDNFNEDKRMREFIGKRLREFVGKRMRDFVGK